MYRTTANWPLLEAKKWTMESISTEGRRDRNVEGEGGGGGGGRERERDRDRERAGKREVGESIFASNGRLCF